MYEPILGQHIPIRSSILSSNSEERGGESDWFMSYFEWLVWGNTGKRICYRSIAVYHLTNRSGYEGYTQPVSLPLPSPGPELVPHLPFYYLQSRTQHQFRPRIPLSIHPIWFLPIKWNRVWVYRLWCMEYLIWGRILFAMGRWIWPKRTGQWSEYRYWRLLSCWYRSKFSPFRFPIYRKLIYIAREIWMWHVLRFLIT